MPLTDEFDYDAPSAWADLSLSVVGPVLSASDVAPLVDEFSRRHHVVRLSVIASEPPAAGLSEIAMTLVVTAPVALPAAAYFTSFFTTWAAEDAKALRAKLYRFIRDRPRGTSGRRYIPFEVILGGARFYFHGEMTDREFRRRLGAATDLLQTLPDDVFKTGPGPGEYGYFWDTDGKAWRGMNYAQDFPSGRAVWFPDDLFPIEKTEEPESPLEPLG